VSINVLPRTIVAKASPMGPAAGILQTEYPLLSILGKQTEQQKMQMAWKLGISVPWIRAAERVIGGEFATVPWHLEDDNEATIDKGDAFDLIATPQMNTTLGKKLTRNDHWRLTCRHMGLCGNAFWYLDGLNTYGQPNAILYIRPDRMTPVDDEQGNLIGWLIDKTQNDPGIGVRLDQIVQFMFEPPDVGHFGIGLVESALMKAQLSTALDRHLGNVIDAGGRLSGIMSPKQGQMGPDTMVSLERDWRSVVEQDNAAKRLQLVAAPVDFTPTTMTLNEIGIRDLITGARDDLLGLWGVPISKLGIHDRGKGLGASNIIENDDAVLWTDAVKPRLGGHDEGGFVEAVQALLDRFAVTDGTCELVIEEPTFDDDAPKYVEAQQALNIPMRNRDRLAILGMEPFGDDVLNPETGLPYDDEVWLPMTMVRSFVAPSDGQVLPTPAAATPMETDSAGRAAGETSGTSTIAAPETAMKAGMQAIRPSVKPLHDSLVNLRTGMDRHMTPRVRSSVQAFLDEQRHDIAERIRKNAAHLAHDPNDTAVWFPTKTYNEKLAAALAPTLSHVARETTDHISSALPSPMKAD
jgi:hypothetical protein